MYIRIKQRKTRVNKWLEGLLCLALIHIDIENRIFLFFLCDPKQWITLNTIVGCFGKHQQKKKRYWKSLLCMLKSTTFEELQKLKNRSFFSVSQTQNFFSLSMLVLGWKKRMKQKKNFNFIYNSWKKSKLRLCAYGFLNNNWFNKNESDIHGRIFFSRKWNEKNNIL